MSTPEPIAAPPPPPEPERDTAAPRPPPPPEPERDTAAPHPPPPPTGRDPVWGSLDVLSMVALALPALVAATALVLGVSMVFGAPRSMKAPQVLAVQFLFWGFWFLALWGLIRGKHRRPFWRSLGWVALRERFWRSALVGVLTAGGVIVAGTLLRPPQIKMPLLELLRDPVSIFLVGFFAVTLGPLCEELAFRGFLLPWAIRTISAPPAIVLTALLFASLHGPEYAWSWQHVLLITCAGAAFGWMRYRTGSTAAATVMHAAYNMVFFIALLAQRQQL